MSGFNNDPRDGLGHKRAPAAVSRVTPHAPLPARTLSELEERECKVRLRRVSRYTPTAIWDSGRYSQDCSAAVVGRARRLRASRRMRTTALTRSTLSPSPCGLR